MAVNDPTSTYGWLLPDVGGDVGAWGGMLRSIFGEDTGPVLGLDAVIKAVSDVADAALPATGGTATGNLEIAPSGGESLLTLNRPATTENSDIAYDSEGAPRARAGITNNADADYRVRVFDNGGVGTNVLTIDRSTFEVSVSNDLTVGGDLNVGALVGNGSGLTNLNASNIATGTLNNARLSDTVATGRFQANSSTNGSPGFNFGADPDAGMHLASAGTLQFNTAGTTRFQITAGALSAVGGAVFSGNGSGLTNLNASNLSSGVAPVARIPNLDASKITSGSFDNARLSGSYTNIVNLTASGIGIFEDVQIGTSGTAISRVQVFQFTFSGNPGLPSGNVTSQTFTASNVTASSKLVATLNGVTSDQFIVTRAAPGAGQVTIFIHNAGATTIDPDGTTVTVLEFVTV